MAEVIVNAKNFQQEVLESDKPVLVDFWAEWCQPCQMMGPVIAELAEAHPEIKVCKCNVDDNTELSIMYNILSIPFFGFFKDGKLVKTNVGYQPFENLENFIK